MHLHIHHHIFACVLHMRVHARVRCVNMCACKHALCRSSLNQHDDTFSHAVSQSHGRSCLSVTKHIGFFRNLFQRLAQEHNFDYILVRYVHEDMCKDVHEDMSTCSCAAYTGGHESIKCSSQPCDGHERRLHSPTLLPRRILCSICAWPSHINPT